MLLAGVLQTMPALCQSLFSLLPATGHLADGFKPTEQCPAYSTNSCNISPPSSPSEGRCGLHNSQRPLPERWAGANSSSDSALQSVFTRQSSRPNALPLHVLSQRGSLSVILAVLSWHLAVHLPERTHGVWFSRTSYSMHSWGGEPTGYHLPWKGKSGHTKLSLENHWHWRGKEEVRLITSLDLEMLKMTFY